MSVISDPVSRIAARRRTLIGVAGLLCALAMILVLKNRAPVSVIGPRVELQATGKSTTALVFGGGSGVQFIRASAKPTSFHADLARGPLRVFALREIQLTATKIPDPVTIALSGTGHVVQLKKSGDRVWVTAGF